MKRRRFTDDQIVGILSAWSAGSEVADLVRQHAVSEQTLYRWKKKYGNRPPSDGKRLKALEEENGQLRRLVVDQALSLQALRDLLDKK